uniref:Sushi domain-containing protein n=1 Tax=Xiphophorus maculatus TaxID=8083 RepID=A0A3B5R6I7_XIPMA
DLPSNHFYKTKLIVIRNINIIYPKGLNEQKLNLGFYKHNTVLTEESLLKSEFPNGTVITYECRNGYYKVNGTGTMNCVDGKWTEPDIICSKKDCGLLEAQPHMLFNTSEGTQFGAMVKVTCDEGYVIFGSSYRKCLEIGWYGKGDCVRKCINSLFFNTVGQRYTMVGTDTIRCTETAEYDYEPPQCIGKFCFISDFTEDRLAETIYKQFANTFVNILNCLSTTCKIVPTAPSSPPSRGPHSAISRSREQTMPLLRSARFSATKSIKSSRRTRRTSTEPHPAIVESPTDDPWVLQAWILNRLQQIYTDKHTRRELRLQAASCAGAILTK